MSVPVILRRLAQAEFDDAADWYEGRRSGRGTAFTVAVRQVLTAIGLQPQSHPEVYGDVREDPVPGFPYAVYYRPESARVVVWPFSTRRAIPASGKGGSEISQPGR